MGWYTVRESDSAGDPSDAPSSTDTGGQPVESVDSSSTEWSDPDTPRDIALDALADARQGARQRDRFGGGRGKGGRTGRRRGGPAVFSGPAPDRRDPARAGDVLDGLLKARGWDGELRTARLFADWAALVGPDIAARCHPVSLRGGELAIAAESTAWATQLRLLSSTLLARLAAELGPSVVSKVRITGPVAPSWKHGPWSVRGRGPRDTYG